MGTVTLSRNEYLKLKRQAQAYRKLAGRFFETALKDPFEDVVADFRKTGLYEARFLTDLGEGLRRSSYFQK